MKVDRRLRTSLIILSLLGLADSLYLTVVKFTNNKGLCLEGIGDCWTVNISRYSEIAGIPVAVLGAIAYLALFLLLLLETRGSFWKEYSPLLVFGLTLAGLLFSIYLTYIEIAVIHAICPFCVISAVIIAIMFVVAVIRLMTTHQAESNL